MVAKEPVKPTKPEPEKPFNFSEFMVEDQMGGGGMSQEQYMKEQMEAMKAFKRQQDRFKEQQKHNLKGRYNFKDDDPTEQVDLTKFS